MQKLYPRGEGKIEAPQPILDQLSQLVTLRKMVAQGERSIEELKFEVQRWMEGHAEVYADGQAIPIKPLVTWNHTKDRVAIDHKALLAEVLELYERYIDDEELAELVAKHSTVTSPGPRQFLIKDRIIAEHIEKTTGVKL